MKGVNDEVLVKYKEFISGAEHVYEAELKEMSRLFKKKLKIEKEFIKVVTDIAYLDYYITFKG